MSHRRNTVQRRGAVAVIVRKDRLLVIRRSQQVVAPGAFCFPGGAIEAGESETDALQRELQEEISAAVRPIQRIWQSTTPWNVRLAWWTAELLPDSAIKPVPAEVESVHWLTVAEMRALGDLLESNRHFLDAVHRGEVRLDGIS